MPLLASLEGSSHEPAGAAVVLAACLLVFASIAAWALSSPSLSPFVLARRLDDRALRWLVIAFGDAVGMRLLLAG